MLYRELRYWFKAGSLPRILGISEAQDAKDDFMLSDFECMINDSYKRKKYKFNNALTLLRLIVVLS